VERRRAPRFSPMPADWPSPIIRSHYQITRKS